MASMLDLRNMENLSYSVTNSDTEVVITFANGLTSEILGSLAVSKKLSRGLFEHMRIVLEYLNGNFEENYVPEAKFNTTAMTGTITMLPPPETRL